MEKKFIYKLRKEKNSLSVFFKSFTRTHSKIMGSLSQIKNNLNQNQFLLSNNFILMQLKHFATKLSQWNQKSEQAFHSTSLQQIFISPKLAVLQTFRENVTLSCLNRNLSLKKLSRI